MNNTVYFRAASLKRKFWIGDTTLVGDYFESKGLEERQPVLNNQHKLNPSIQQGILNRGRQGHMHIRFFNNTILVTIKPATFPSMLKGHRSTRKISLTDSKSTVGLLIFGQVSRILSTVQP